VDGKHVVFAAGSLQLINALSDAGAASPPARVVATTAYYTVSSQPFF
jgi:hypothetical protein